MTFFVTESSAQSLTAKDTAEVRFLNGRKYFLYEVRKSETLFSISQKFDIPVDEITELNPVVKEGIKPKTKLWIPAFSWKSKSPPVESIKPPAAEPAKKDDRWVQIAVISNLGLGKSYTGEIDPGDSAVQELLDPTTVSNLEFVEGAEIAAGKFQSANPSYRIRFNIVDSEDDSSRLSKNFWKADWRKADVWITNAGGPVLAFLNRMSSKTGVLLLSCGVNTSDRISENKYAVAMLPSSLLQCRTMGAETAGLFKNANAVFVKTNNAKEADRMQAMKEGWCSVNPAWMTRISDYSKGFGKSVLDSLRSGKKNLVFIPSSNEDMITGLLLALKEKKRTIDLSVVGLPTWYNFETVDPALMQECDVHFFNSGSLEHGRDDAGELRKVFRDTYNGEPGEGAYLGYDACKLMLEARKKSGAEVFIKELPRTYEGLFSDYTFKRNGKEGSCENQNILIWNFKDHVPQEVGH